MDGSAPMRMLRRTFVCALAGVLVVTAMAQTTQVPQCTAEKLDVTVRTQPESATRGMAHLMVIEFRKRGQDTCFMTEFELTFPPDSNMQGWGPWTPDPSPSAAAFQQRSFHLEANELVHILVAWSSKPTSLSSIVTNDCVTHDTMTLSGALPGGHKAFLEVRHLWMQSCGEVYRSSYRPGPYVPGEPIPQEWFDRRQIVRRTAGPAAQWGPAPQITHAFDVEYLKGTFESGYSGYFELFLKEPSPALANCPFESLKKREADGQTLIYLNHCPDGSLPPVPAGTEMRLMIREMGLLPERPGRVEYGITSEVLQDRKAVLKSSELALSIREPTQPMVPAIDGNTPGCRAAQLKLVQSIELGDHWSQPRTFPPMGEEWHDAKVFEVQNVSTQSCRLGGAPQLKALHLPEIKTGGLLLPMCRNCSTPLFNPRESQWINLGPNDSAHFMVGRTLFDPNYFFMCTIVGSFEITLPGDEQPIGLPFEGISCGQVHESAWRAGRYDGDPMNVKYERDRNEREQKRLAASQPPPKKCAEEVSLDTGRPVMLLAEGGLEWGVSTKPAPYGEPISILLWLNNPTSKTQPVMTCGEIDFFWFGGVDVFDSSGHRILSRAEQNHAKEGVPGMDTVFVCSRNFPIGIPAHTCTHGAFSTLAYDFSRDLRTNYDLPPGRYYLVPKRKNENGKPVNQPWVEPVNGLAVDVLE